MAIVTGTLAATKIGAAKKVLVEQVRKEVARKGKKVLLKKGADKLADATESKNVKEVERTLTREGLAATETRPDLGGRPPKETEKIVKDGPQDVLFDLNKNKYGEDVRCFDESKFRPGIDGVPGRKPTPDAVLVDDRHKETLFVEDKRPSECAHNSWLSTYDKDPMREYRLQQAKAFGKKEISRERAEARVIIREHDIHMNQRPQRWQNPEGVPDGYSEKLMIRVPSDEKTLIDALVKELKDTGRKPEIIENQGVTSIKYKQLDKPIWGEKEIGKENGKIRCDSRK